MARLLAFFACLGISRQVASSAELGCSESDIGSGKTIVRAHGTLKGYRGIMVLLKDNSCVISAPEGLVQELSEKFTGMLPNSAFDPSVFQRFLGSRLEKFVGPAWLGQMTPETYVRRHDETVREISDWDQFEKFLSDCPQHEVELSSLQRGRAPVEALFRDEKIVTAAGFELMENVVAHIGILTHPAHRGHGFAKQAISAIVENVFKRKLGPQYWTHGKNIPSIRAATDVGFIQFAETLAIRLT